jgi:hypothetical protein
MGESGGVLLDRLDAIKIFVRVVESGSFSAVARKFVEVSAGLERLRLQRFEAFAATRPPDPAIPDEL